ncbi:MAG TPA: DUF2911 domain-containing protein [Gemmatimonadales bacterium]|jgi:hypothetical protein|nr:DUF2911 domain-containing protein [Gemmatimonadales bacterium]
MTRSLTLLAAVLALAPGALAAQAVHLSQPATVTQRVGNAAVTIVYNRPSARGRKLFGGVVAWGRVWCPGADSATTIAFSSNVRVAGQPLAAGKYSVWAIPQPDEWTLIFSKAADVFHVPYPGAAHDALRITVKPKAGPFFETLAFYFPSVESDQTLLALQWGETMVPIPITLR